MVEDKTEIRNNGFDVEYFVCNPDPKDKLPKLDSRSNQLAAELWHAAARGDLKEVQKLCSKHDLKNDHVQNLLGGEQSSSQYRQHAFSAAVEYNKPTVLEFLYDIGAKPTPEDVERACRTYYDNWDIDLFKLFIRHGVDLSPAFLGSRALTSFNDATVKEEMVDLWLSQGADPNGGIQADDSLRNYSTPLSMSLARGQYEQARKLVAHGADAHFGGCANAVLSSCMEIDMDKACELMEWVLECGADPNKMEGGSARYFVKRPLHIAATMQGTEPLIELLIKHGADPTASCGHGRTPLDWAIDRNTNSPRKEELFRGARGGLHPEAYYAELYKKMNYLPLSGFDLDAYMEMVKDEPDEAKDTDEDEDGEDEGENEEREARTSILSRLSSIFTRGPAQK